MVLLLSVIVCRSDGVLSEEAVWNYYLLLYAGQMVYSVRKRCGIQLAKESPVEADIVSTVPDSATPAAIEYARMVSLWLCGVPLTEYRILLFSSLLKKIKVFSTLCLAGNSGCLIWVRHSSHKSSATHSY